MTLDPRPLVLFFGIFAVVWLWQGYDVAFFVAYGMAAAMASVIAVTFLWLWRRRSTPLALGMALCKIGYATVFLWYAVHKIRGNPVWQFDHGVFLFFVATYFVGAAMHFAVMEVTMKKGPWFFILPVAVAAVILLVIASH
jgi:hypothetical protein